MAQRFRICEIKDKDGNPQINQYGNVDTELVYVENPTIEAFLDDIEAVCKKHLLSIGHEDSQGGFKIEEFDDYNIDWLRAAEDCTMTPKEVYTYWGYKEEERNAK